MSFSRAQQRGWQEMIRAAWAAHCLAEGRAFAPPKWDRAWYEEELFAATGERSTIELNSGRDYDRAMAHFEALGGKDIKWQMRLHSGDAVRILHQLGKISDDHDVTEEYLRGVAKRALRLDFLPELRLLTHRQLVMVLGEVTRWLRRRKAKSDNEK